MKFARNKDIIIEYHDKEDHRKDYRHNNEREDDNQIEDDQFDDEQYDRKKKKRKKKRYILKIIIAILVLICLYFIATSSLFAIDKIEVEGNTHFSNEEVVELSGIIKGENLFETKMSAAKKKMKSDPYIKGVEVKRKLPNTVNIVLDERSEDALIKNEDGSYVVANSDGIILKITNEPPEAPIIEGLTPVDPKEGDPLGAKEEDEINKSLDFIAFAEENDFFVKKLDVSGVLTKVYVLDSLMCEGTYKDIKNNIESLKLIIQDLLEKGIERGTISVASDGNCSFRPAVE